jgi:hypothetical protein
MPIEPGYKTTEFWATLLGDIVAILALFHIGIPNASQLIQAVAVLGAAIVTAVYSHGRSRIKTAQVAAPLPATLSVTASTPAPSTATSTTMTVAPGVTVPAATSANTPAT